MYSFLKKNAIKAPIDGTIIPLDSVPDLTFSNRMVGDGIAILPSNTLVVSPCSGFISMIASSKHAIGIIGSDGIEILIHIGINTMALNGEVFEILVKVGDIVSIGTPLMNLSSDLFLNPDIILISPIIICNTQQFNITQITNKKTVEASVHSLFKYEKIVRQ